MRRLLALLWAAGRGAWSIYVFITAATSSPSAFRRDLRDLRHRPQHLHGLYRTGLVRPERLRGDRRLHLRGADRDHGWEPLAALPRSAFSARSCALIVGYPTLRLRGHYLAMATFALGLIVYEVAVQWQSVTQGYMGYSGIPPLGIGRFELTSDRAQLDLRSSSSLLLGVWSPPASADSRFGRAFAPSPAARRRRARSASMSRATSSRPS